MKTVLIALFFTFSHLVSAQTEQSEIAQKELANSIQPIIYGVGVAGITKDTLYEDATTILTPPSLDKDGMTLYNEGIYVSWNSISRKPNYIMILENYKGEMSLPPPFDPIKMKYDFSNNYKRNTIEGAEAIARDYYRLLENAGHDYDCISQHTCKINWGDDKQKEFFFEIPGRTTWMITKDRFVLNRMVLFFN